MVFGNSQWSRGSNCLIVRLDVLRFRSICLRRCTFDEFRAEVGDISSRVRIRVADYLDTLEQKIWECVEILCTFALPYNIGEVGRVYEVGRCYETEINSQRWAIEIWITECTTTSKMATRSKLQILCAAWKRTVVSSASGDGVGVRVALPSLQRGYGAGREIRCHVTCVPGIWWRFGCQIYGQCDVRSREGFKRDMGTLVIGEKKHECGETMLLHYLETLNNYEREGVPKNAGVDSEMGFDLDRMHRLLVRLGDPLSAYQVVHVAGTKGKGSTVSFISNILRAAGFSVGTYTSPHITSIRERITAGRSGDPISADTLRKLLIDKQATIDEAVAAESGLLTHFEVLTALAFTHFARESVDVAVIETGLGGARDATNVITAKGLAAAVIVGIGSEHLAALGGSLESIARAKAGIIKQNRPVIVGRQTESLAKDVILEVAAAKRARVIAAFGPMVKCRSGSLCTDVGHTFQLCDISISDLPVPDSEGAPQNWEMENLKLRILGAHQQDNALTAVSTVLVLRSQGWNIPDSAIRVGLETTEMPGRFQVVDQQCSEALGCVSNRLILDGAHTEGSAIALAKTLRDAFPKASLALVVAMACDKDHSAFAQALLKDAKPDIVVTTRVPVAGSYDRSISAQELADSWIHAAQSYAYEVYYKKEDLQVHYASGESNMNMHFADEKKGQESRGLLLVLKVESLDSAIREAAIALEQRCKEGGMQSVICVTGSLHAVAGALLIPRQGN